MGQHTETAFAVYSKGFDSPWGLRKGRELGTGEAGLFFLQQLEGKVPLKESLKKKKR